ncbi:MAG: hypothetical protein J3R72DRAFT_450327 [Linnemannia gamsii]|nr:MAG: hypothetical protein J3R72DRAFT_450327 [Linnemannia gamsii]
MVDITLFCILDKTPHSQAFPITIPLKHTVGHLKNLIKAEQSPYFDDIAASTLDIWKVTIANVNEFSSVFEMDKQMGNQLRLDNPRLGMGGLSLHESDKHVYIVVRRPPLLPPAPASLKVHGLVSEQASPNESPSLKSAVTPNNNNNSSKESSLSGALATAISSKSSNKSLFDGWQSLSPSGRVDRDGFLLCTSRLNTDMIGYTSNVQRFSDSKRDKHGQGSNSVLMPVMENETYEVQGADRVWFMGLRRV